MHPKWSLLGSISLAALVLAHPQTAQKVVAESDGACPPLHMLIARATAENQVPGLGWLKNITDPVSQQIKDADAEAVQYPADGISFSDPDHPNVDLTEYRISEGYGTGNMTKQLKDFVARCPHTPVALMGFSQGAQVVGDVICGTTSLGFEPTMPLNASYARNIVAVLQVGDPSNVKNLPWHQGTAKYGSNFFPRRDFTACQPLYSNKWQSYCEKADLFCSLGSKLKPHLSYFLTDDHYKSNMTAFIVNSVPKQLSSDEL